MSLDSVKNMFKENGFIVIDANANFFLGLDFVAFKGIDNLWKRGVPVTSVFFIKYANVGKDGLFKFADLKDSTIETFTNLNSHNIYQSVGVIVEKEDSTLGFLNFRNLSAFQSSGFNSIPRNLFYDFNLFLATNPKNIDATIFDSTGYAPVIRYRESNKE